MYAIAGITGQTGSSVAEHLLAAGRTVRALVRSPDRAASWAERGVELAQADLGELSALTQALGGAQGAYLLLPPNWTSETYVEDLEAQAETMAAAIHAADVPRVVILSSIAVQQPSGTGPIRTLRPLEAALKDRPGVTFLRAAYFQENLRSALEPARSQGAFYAFSDPDSPMDMVSTADIGRWAADLLQLPPEDAPRVVHLAGPARLSLREAAETLEEGIGRSLRVQRLPAAALGPVLREQGAGQIADLYVEMNEGMDAGRLTWPEGATIVRGTTSLRQTVAGW